MRRLFWSSVGVIGYTYFGYPAWLWLRSRGKSAPAPFLPSISIVKDVRNQATGLERKVTSAMLPGIFFRVVLFLQAGFYASAMWSNEQPGRNVFARGPDRAFTFVLLNVAALVAFGKFVSGSNPVWTR